MSYKPQSSFSAGEYDPALWERTTIQKRDSGLSKLRGFFVGKTGRLISLPGTTYDNVTRKLTGRKVVTYHPPFSKYEVEMGHLYGRIHDLDAGTFEEFVTTYREDDLPYIQFTASQLFIYTCCKGRPLYKIVLGALDLFDPNINARIKTFETIYGAPPALSSFDITITPAGAPAGYNVEYVATYILNGEESVSSFGNPVQGKLPIASAQSNKISVIVTKPTAIAKKIKEVRVYRRPEDGQEYGFIGSTFTIANETTFGGDTARTFELIDYGGAADFAHIPPQTQNDFSDDSVNALGNRSIRPDAILIYQRRLNMNGTKDRYKGVIFSSRTKYHNNFTRDFPISATSSLAFETGAEESAKILRFIDVGGLGAFTTQGLYSTDSTALIPETAFMTRKGNWVIDETVPPLTVPGGFLFVEKSTGAIIEFNYSTELTSFSGREISIFSNHLFDGKRVKSWAFQSGLNPLIWIVMDDGTVNILTYLPEQEMRAWSWTNTDGKYETVGVRQNIDGSNTIYFTVLRNGVRVREKLAERFNVDFKDYIGCHSAKVFKTRMTGTVDATQLVGATYALVGDPGTFANTAGNGAVGSQFRFFSKTGTPITFQVTAYVSTNEVTVLSIDDREIPADELNDLVIYKVFTTVTGLTHLEGKQVYVKNDGFIESNPLAKTFEGEDRYGIKTVIGGQITLDNPGAIVIVGLPMVNDARLLEVDTVEQQPALLASVTLNKVELAYYRSRGVHTSYDFPDDDTTKGMTDSESYIADDMTIQAAEVPLLPYSKRVEIIDVGSWDSHGQFAMRHVDGHPIEILSVISDLDVLRKRGN